MLEPGGEGPKPRFQNQSSIFEHRNGGVTFALQHSPKAVPGRPGRGAEFVHSRRGDGGLVEAESNLLP